MVRSALGKVAWVGRTASMVFGLALVLALLFGVASIALGGTGVGATFNLGKLNTVNRISQLVGAPDNAMLRVANNSAGTNATALDLRVQPGRAPMWVDSSTQVANLNADYVDGQNASAFAPVNTNAFVRNSTYRAEDPASEGALLPDGTRAITKSCQPGDTLLSGGPANIRDSSDLLESFPSSTTTWSARINNNGLQDNWNVVVLCADQ